MTAMLRSARKAVLLATTALALGAAGIAAAQGAAGPATSAQAWTQKATHGNWDVICTRTADAKENCRAIQLLETRKQNEAQDATQRVLRLVAQKAPKGLVFSFELPFGVDLRPGMVYQIDANPEISVPYLTCLPGGCLASVELKDERRSQMTSGKELKVGFRPLGSEKVVVVEVNLAGLDKAIAAL